MPRPLAGQPNPKEDIGHFAAGTRLIFKLAGESGTFFTHLWWNPDKEVHVLKKRVGRHAWELWWEDQAHLRDHDFNDFVVRISITT